MIQVSSTFIGIDVSKATLDISLAKKHFKIENSSEAICTFIHNEILNKQIKPTLVCLESTGGYEISAMKSFQHVGIPVHRAHPNKVYAFAKAAGHFAKTDKLDAQLLEKYAFFVSDLQKGDAPRTDTFYYLHALRQIEIDLMENIHATQCRIKMGDSSIFNHLARQLTFFENELEIVRNDIEETIRSNKEFMEKRELMISIPGIGKQISNALLADLPELGNIGNKQITSLTGLAPKTYESGTKFARGHISGGRFYARKALFMAALVASKHDIKIKTIYTRLVEAGKPKKVALVAIMRKIIICLNVMIKNNQKYRKMVDI